MSHLSLLVIAILSLSLGGLCLAQTQNLEELSLAHAEADLNAKKMNLELAQAKLQAMGKNIKKAKIKAAKQEVEKAQDEYEEAKVHYENLQALEAKRQAIEAQIKEEQLLSPETQVAKQAYLRAETRAQELQTIAQEARAKAGRSKKGAARKEDPVLLKKAQEAEEDARAATLEAETKKIIYEDAKRQDLKKVQTTSESHHSWSNLELQASFVYDLNRYFEGRFTASDMGISILGGVREKYYGLYGNLTLTYQSFEGFDESSHVYFGAFFAPRLFLPIIDPLTLYFTSHVGLRLGHESAFLLTHDAGAEYVLNPQFSLTFDLCSWSFSSNEQDLKIAFGVIFHPNAE